MVIGLQLSGLNGDGETEHVTVCCKGSTKVIMTSRGMRRNTVYRRCISVRKKRYFKYMLVSLYSCEHDFFVTT